MATIPRVISEPDLHHLQVLDVLLREHSLTRAARTLNVTQPALSKTLARLRRYFDDPLFVRVALRMEPTPKALQAAGAGQRDPRADAVAAQRARLVRSAHLAPHLQFLRGRRRPHQAAAAAGRRGCSTEAPERAAERAAARGRSISSPGSSPASSISPWARFRRSPRASAASRCGSNAMSAWRGAAIRASSADPTLRAFAAEKHVLVSIAGSGHAHQQAERALEAAIPPENIICRMPMFIGAAIAGKAHRCGRHAAAVGRDRAGEDLDLQVITPPIKLPKIDIFQYWHDRLSPRSRQSMDPRRCSRPCFARRRRHRDDIPPAYTKTCAINEVLVSVLQKRHRRIPPEIR